MSRLAVDLAKTFNARSIEKYGVKASKQYRDQFKKKSLQVLYSLIQMFANEVIKTPSKWVANRDYNVLTEIGIPEIKLVAECFEIETTEVDVNSAFVRILYALNHVNLPEDFYGVNKENKLEINVFLNDFFYDETKKSLKKVQRKRAYDKFIKLGFDAKVVDYLMTNFFESRHRGSLFNFLTFYEKQVVSKLKATALEDFKTEGVGRRHDSLLLFNNETDLQRLNHLDFLGRNGWFKVAEIEVEESYQDWYNREILPQKTI